MERNTTIDVMKCIAVFVVVSLHTVTYSYDWQGVDYIQFITSIFPRWVIPFFFIAAGYFFGQKMNSHRPRIYFKQYVSKLIGLFITWYLFYLIYDLVLQMVLAVYMGLNLKVQLLNYVTSFVDIKDLYYGTGMTSYHLWFLTALIWSIVALYAAIRFNKLGLLLILSCILHIIGLFGQTYSSIFHLPIQTKDALFFGLFYATIGCYFTMHYGWLKERLKGIKISTLIYLFLIFSVIQNVERIVTVSVLDGTKGFGDYYATTAFLTISLFLVALKNSTIGRISLLAKLGKNAVGIYVSHLFVISAVVLLLNFLGIDYLRSRFLFNMVFIVMVFIISYYFFLLFNSFLNRTKILFSLLNGNRRQWKGENKTAI